MDEAKVQADEGVRCVHSRREEPTLLVSRMGLVVDGSDMDVGVWGLRAGDGSGIGLQ